MENAAALTSRSGGGGGGGGGGKHFGHSGSCKELLPRGDKEAALVTNMQGSRYFLQPSGPHASAPSEGHAARFCLPSICSSSLTALLRPSGGLKRTIKWKKRVKDRKTCKNLVKLGVREKP